MICNYFPIAVFTMVAVIVVITGVT